MPGLRSSSVAFAPIAVLLAALALVYGRVGGFGYVAFDDPEYVLNNAVVSTGLTESGVRWAFTTFYASNWHPLTWLSLMLDVSLFGLAPGAAHWVNVAIHGSTSLLLYALATRALNNAVVGLLVALLFLIHPLHVESVAWIAERKDVLCGFFYVLSLFAYLRYAERPGAIRYFAVLGAFALALLSKPMAVTLPVALILLDYWPLHRLRGRVVLEKLPLFAMSLAVGLVTLVAQSSAISGLAQVPLWFRSLHGLVAYATYLRDLVAPTRLAVFYPMQHTIGFWDALVPALLVLGAISTAALRWRVRMPWLLFGWLWFLLTLVPVIGLVQVGIQSHADRYMYVPSIGLFLALGAALAAPGAPARKALLAIVPALVFYAHAARLQVGYWHGTDTLATHALEVVGDSLPLHTMLAGFYLEQGRLEEAESIAKRTVQLWPDSSLPYANLATVLLQKKQFALAERMFREASSKAPLDANMLNNLGIALEGQGRIEEAPQSFAAALEKNPDLAQARQNLRRVGG
jgi:protein O-mannosyl-transferase